MGYSVGMLGAVGVVVQDLEVGSSYCNGGQEVGVEVFCKSRENISVISLGK